MTTADLDALAEKRIAQAGATPAFKGYHGYPATICASVNEEVIHGIPSGRRVLNEGDIISIDVGASLDGYFGDSAITLPVGQVSEEAATLLRVTEESLYKAIERGEAGRAGLGHRPRGAAARRGATGFRWCASSSGTASAQQMHEEPQVPNYGEPGRGPRLAEGMVLAIEPMVNAGQAGGEGAGGRLDGGDARRQPVGALRAHGGGDGGRAVDSDGAGSAGRRAAAAR